MCALAESGLEARKRAWGIAKGGETLVNFNQGRPSSLGAESANWTGTAGGDDGVTKAVAPLNVVDAVRIDVKGDPFGEASDEEEGGKNYPG